MLRQEGEVGGNRDVRLVAVGNDAPAELFRERRDAHQFGDTAGHGHVGLRDVDLAADEGFLVFEACGESEIAAADRYAKALEAGMAVEVVDRQRRLDPEEIVLLEDWHQRQALIRIRPGGGGVDHQADIRSDMLTRGTDQHGRLVEVVAPERVGNDLDRLEAELQATVDVPAYIVRCLAERIDGAIGEHAVALASPE